MINRRSQTYYAECLQPDQERGLRISIKLTRTKPDQLLPDHIPAQPCLSGARCPDGGTHDLLPISAQRARVLMAEDDG